MCVASPCEFSILILYIASNVTNIEEIAAGKLYISFCEGYNISHKINFILRRN